MATYTTPSRSFNITSKFNSMLDVNVEGSTTMSFDFSGIPSNSTVNSARIYYSQNLGSSYVRSLSPSNGGSVGAPAGGSRNYTFRFTATPRYEDITITLTSVRVVVDYTPGGGGGGTSTGGDTAPPSRVWTSKTSAAPGELITLEWDWASWGYIVWYGDNDSSCPHYLDPQVNGGQKLNVYAPTGYNVTRYFRVSSKAPNNPDLAAAGPKSTAYGYVTSTWTNPSTPGTPKVSQNNVKPGQTVTLSWSQSSSGTHNPLNGYIVQRSVDNVNWGVLSATTSTSLAVQANTGANSSYYYRVCATGDRSDSAYSGSVRLISAVGTLAKPTNLRIGGQTSVEVAPKTTQALTWTAVSNATNNTVSGYTIQRLITGGSWANLATVAANVTTYNVTASGTNNVAHSYRVRANGSYSNGDFASAVSHTCSYTLPTVSSPQVSSTKVQPGSGDVTFSWTASDGTRLPIASFTIYRDNVVWKSGIGASQRSYAVPSHTTQGAAYSYSVVAIGSVSGYNSSRSANATVTTYGNPSAPTAITINNVAGTVYIGTTVSAPTLTLRWSGAEAGAHATITRFQILKNGVHLKYVTVTTTSGSTKIPNTEEASYSVKTEASSGLVSGASTARSVSLIQLPDDISFTVEPSGRTNGIVRYTWDAVSVSNATIKYGLAYKKGANALKQIGQIDGTTYDLNIATDNLIAPGEDYQLAVIAQAYATHGGITQRDYVLSSSGAYRSVNPAAPTITSIKDKGGNTSYTHSRVDGVFTYEVPNRGSPNVEYTVYYRYGTTGGFTSLGKFPNKTFTHATTSITGGTQIYYRVEVTDEYGNSNSTISSSAITRINNPVIDTPTYVPGSDVPHTQGTITFTPRDGGTSRPLAYRIRLLYNGEAFAFRDYTSVSNIGSLLTDTRNDIDIVALRDGGLNKLFTQVITNRVVSIPITVEISLRDNQTIPVSDNVVTYSFNRTLDFRTKPVLTGTIGVRNKTADTNQANGVISSTIDYLNSNDEVEWDFSNLNYTWTNAAGTTDGANLKIEIIDSTGSSSLNDWPTDNKKTYTMGIIQNDSNISSSVRVIQNYANDITGVSETKTKSIGIKRFVKPSFLLTNYERTAPAIFKTTLQFSDALSGGSNTIGNVLSITDVNITDGTTPNIIDDKLVIDTNRLMIEGLQAPRVLTGLYVTNSFDAVVSITGKLMTSSGQIYDIVGASILIKAIGAAMAIRKSRVGINVEPTQFLDDFNKPSLVLTEKNSNVSGPQFEIIGSILNNDGAGIKWVDAKTNTNGIINFKNGIFSINNGEILTSLNYSDHIPVVTWANIAGKPSTFPPSTHNHTKAQITDFPTSMPASDVYAWAKEETKPEYTYTEVGAAASSHSHSYLPLSGGGTIKYSLGGSATIINSTNNDANAYNQPNTYGIAITGGNNILSIGLGSTSNDRKAFIQSGHNSPQYATSVGELWLNPLGGTVRIGAKTGNIALHSGNYTAYVTPANIGAAAASHHHDDRHLRWGNINQIGATDTANLNTLPLTFPFIIRLNTITTGFPGASWSQLMQITGGSDTVTQIGLPYNGNTIYFRSAITGGINDRSWTEVLSSSNYINYVYPVGAIYISYSSTSPATLFGGTWSAIGAGRFLVAAGTGYAAGATGGAATHVHSTATMALTVAQLPSHTHILPHFRYGSFSSSAYSHIISGSNAGTHYENKTAATGSGTAHGHGNTGSASSLPPYYAVYMWRRTA